MVDFLENHGKPKSKMDDLGIPLFEETSIYKDYMKCIGQSLLVKRLSQSLAGLLVAIQFPFIATKIKDKTTHPSKVDRWE